MPQSEKVNTKSDYPTPIKDTLHILKELDYLQELKEVEGIISEEEKIRFANVPKVFVIEEHRCGLASYIRNERKLYQRYGHDNGDHMSFLLLNDLWDDLQKNKHYVGQLKHPWTGENLPESCRYPNKESEGKLGIRPGLWEVGTWSAKKVYLELLQAETGQATL